MLRLASTEDQECRLPFVREVAPIYQVRGARVYMGSQCIESRTTGGGAGGETFARTVSHLPSAMRRLDYLLLHFEDGANGWRDGTCMMYGSASYQQHGWDRR